MFNNDVVPRPPKQKCDACNKDMTPPVGSPSIVGMQFVPCGLNEFDKSYMKAQFGGYLPSGYHVCFECFLKAFGVKQVAGAAEALSNKGKQ